MACSLHLESQRWMQDKILFVHVHNFILYIDGLNQHGLLGPRTEARGISPSGPSIYLHLKQQQTRFRLCCKKRGFLGSDTVQYRVLSQLLDSPCMYCHDQLPRRSSFNAIEPNINITNTPNIPPTLSCLPIWLIFTVFWIELSSW